MNAKILEKHLLASRKPDRVPVLQRFFKTGPGEYGDTLGIAEILLVDREDLIHKAVGWMLREVGNRDVATEKEFLQRHHRTMPRTALRYAIEKFPEKERRAWLNGLS